jgi:hypothetical protein
MDLLESETIVRGKIFPAGPSRPERVERFLPSENANTVGPGRPEIGQNEEKRHENNIFG